MMGILGQFLRNFVGILWNSREVWNDFVQNFCGSFEEQNLGAFSGNLVGILGDFCGNSEGILWQFCVNFEEIWE